MDHETSLQQDAIARFFQANPSVSQTLCDYIAGVTYKGGATVPHKRQGRYSYTVVTAEGTGLVQFRNQEEVVDECALELARSVFGDVVPGFEKAREFKDITV